MILKNLFLLLFLICSMVTFAKAQKIEENLSVVEFQNKLSELVLPYTKDFNTDDVLLKVNELPIYYSDIKYRYLNMLKHHTQMQTEPLTDEIAKNYRKLLLKKEIEKKVLQQEMEKLNLYPSKEIIENEYENLKSKEGPEKFLKNIEFAGFNELTFKEKIKYEMALVNLLSKVDEKALPINAEQIETTYNNNLDKFEIPDKIQFSVIVIKNADESEDIKKKNLETINNIKENIINGKNSFEFYAKNFSDDPNSRKNGGDLGLQLEKDLQEMFNPVKNLNENEISPIYSFKDGYYIAKVTKKEPKKIIPLIEVRDNINNHLKMQEIMKLRQDFLDNLLKNAKVEIIKE